MATVSIYTTMQDPCSIFCQISTLSMIIIIISLTRVSSASLHLPTPSTQNPVHHCVSVHVASVGTPDQGLRALESSCITPVSLVSRQGKQLVLEMGRTPARAAAACTHHPKLRSRKLVLVAWTAVKRCSSHTLGRFKLPNQDSMKSGTLTCVAAQDVQQCLTCPATGASQHRSTSRMGRRGTGLQSLVTSHARSGSR